MSGLCAWVHEAPRWWRCGASDDPWAQSDQDFWDTRHRHPLAFTQACDDGPLAWCRVPRSRVERAESALRTLAFAANELRMNGELVAYLARELAPSAQVCRRQLRHTRPLRARRYCA